MRLLRPAVFLLAAAAMCGGAIASAQTAPAASASQSPESLKGPGSDFWFMGGGSFSTIRGSCQTCEDGVAQFRPWASKGFFVKGGAGMAFVRNWVDVIGPESFNQKALSVMIGTGWVFRPHARVGLEVFAAQHAAALGDLQTSSGQIPDVMGNFWSLGGGIVIR
jgi:hypothetical protein